MQSRTRYRLLLFSPLGKWTTTALALIALVLAGCASTPPPAPRAALVVGNGAYLHASVLTSPANDVSAIAERLRNLGWQVTSGVDLSARDLDRTLEEFRSRTRSSEQVIFFYSGHSMLVDGTNYIVPVDYDPTLGQLAPAVLPIDSTVQRLRTGTGQLAVLLDASYGNSLALDFAKAERDRSGRRVLTGIGLDELRIEEGTYVGYSTTPGHNTYASRGNLSVFARALLAHLGEDDWEIGTIVVFVRDQVMEATGGTQVPWDRSGLTSPFKLGTPPTDDEPEDD